MTHINSSLTLIIQLRTKSFKGVFKALANIAVLLIKPSSAVFM